LSRQVCPSASSPQVKMLRYTISRSFDLPCVVPCVSQPSINTQNAQYKWLTREDLPQLAHILPSLNVAQISVHDVVRTARPVWANPFGGLCHRLRYRHIDRYSHVLGPAQQQHCVRAVRRGISSTPCSVQPSRRPEPSRSYHNW
jgi:hypothetical protein